jgi:hypothetical protein
MAEDGPIRELIRWNDAGLLITGEPGSPAVLVSGETPRPVDRVALEPRKEVVAEPEYWPTEVVAYSSEFGPEVMSPYSVQVLLTELSRGTKGIELIGEDQAEQIDIPG